MKSFKEIMDLIVLGPGEPITSIENRDSDPVLACERNYHGRDHGEELQYATQSLGWNSRSWPDSFIGNEEPNLTHR